MLYCRSGDLSPVQLCLAKIHDILSSFQTTGLVQVWITSHWHDSHTGLYEEAGLRPPFRPVVLILTKYDCCVLTWINEAHWGWTKTPGLHSNRLNPPYVKLFLNSKLFVWSCYCWKMKFFFFFLKTLYRKLKFPSHSLITISASLTLQFWHSISFVLIWIAACTRRGMSCILAIIQIDTGIMDFYIRPIHFRHFSYPGCVEVIKHPKKKKKASGHVH